MHSLSLFLSLSLSPSSLCLCKVKKSSCVARERRNQINDTLCELGTLLCPEQDRLDKLTVVRLASATIKLHSFIRGLDPNRPCQRLQHRSTANYTNSFSKVLTQVNN
eukprot:sb/3477711/